MAIDFAKIRKEQERIKNNEKVPTMGFGGGKKDQLYWRIGKEFGSNAIIRLFPSDQDGNIDEVRLVHYNLDKGMTVCPRHNGEKCKCCEFGFNLMKQGKEANANVKGSGDGIYKSGKDLIAKKQFFARVVVRGEEDKGFRWWSYSEAIHNKIWEIITETEEENDANGHPVSVLDANGDPVLVKGDITNSITGYDLKIEKVNDGTQFGVIKVKTVKKPSKLMPDDEAIKMLMDSAPTFDDMCPPRAASELNEIFDKKMKEGISDNDAENISKEVSKNIPKGNSFDQKFEEFMKKPEEDIF